MITRTEEILKDDLADPFAGNALVVISMYDFLDIKVKKNSFMLLRH